MSKEALQITRRLITLALPILILSGCLKPIEKPTGIKLTYPDGRSFLIPCYSKSTFGITSPINGQYPQMEDNCK